uniref:Claudin n=1 Tax=Chromera velia CCMP2878 TaxID=1169474 RepID=A0A0G4IAT4_9ALVE|eukprot:Cvel_12646.t1-p1 / transcript=Cvel_12646.t1 / gene=Cvel_12646 / organism=Chromera_velia_CCMP2878 / gene_product=hypothetical protein / transcript_product=hypothetical protein / location=Cvel_scaffold835:34462-36123(+) / protein_length=259 / sequence_SO=supercontig / SO=protein_coding / is_pseudo=false
MSWLKTRALTLFYLVCFTLATGLLLVGVLMAGILENAKEWEGKDGQKFYTNATWEVGATRFCHKPHEGSEVTCTGLDSACMRTTNETSNPLEKAEGGEGDGGVFGHKELCDHHNAASIMLFIGMATVGCCAAIQVVALLRCCMKIWDLLTLIGGGFSTIILGIALALWGTIPESKKNADGEEDIGQNYILLQQGPIYWVILSGFGLCMIASVTIIIMYFFCKKCQGNQETQNLRDNPNPEDSSKVKPDVHGNQQNTMQY